MRCVGGLEHLGEIINGEKALIGIVDEEASWKFTTNFRAVGYVSLVLINLVLYSLYWWALVNGGRKMWDP
jgi:hypothetical protein